MGSSGWTGGAVGTVTVRDAALASKWGWGATGAVVSALGATLPTDGPGPTPGVSARGANPIARAVSIMGWGPIGGVPGETDWARGSGVVGVALTPDAGEEPSVGG